MMKIFLEARLLSLICILLFTGMVSSCKKDTDANSGLVELLSFGPTGAKHGDTLRIIGNNLGKVTKVDLTGASVEKSAFLEQTAEVIKLIIPKATQKGFITLVTPGGDIVSKTQLNLNVHATVTAITPTARPGENITITGDFLNWVTRVTFAKEKVVTSFVSQSITELKVTVPMDAETGPLVLFFAGTDSMDLETPDTLKVALPVATSFSPVPVKHQTNLTITGTNLDLTTQLFFTGVPAAITAFESKTATQLVVKVPEAATDGKITLQAASGVQTVSAAEVKMLWPAVTKLDPNPIDPGANLTITGTNLDLVTSVAFENAPKVTSFISKTATQIVVTVPAGVLSGSLTLGVLNSTRTVITSEKLSITGDIPPPTMSFPIYDDAVTSNWTGNSGWIGGGWGGTSDRSNTSPVRAGDKSVKITYEGGWGSPFQLGGANISLAPFTTFKISVYGGPGSNGKKINIGINAADAYTITLVEGKWTDYSVPISTLTNAAKLNEIWVKEYNGSGGFSIYIDALGLD